MAITYHHLASLLIIIEPRSFYTSRVLEQIYSLHHKNTKGKTLLAPGIFLILAGIYMLGSEFLSITDKLEGKPHKLHHTFVFRVYLLY